MPKNDKMYNIKEVADFTGYSSWAVRYWIRHGKITAYKVGMGWRIKDSDLQAFISKGMN